jgi:hypothetical protein
MLGKTVISIISLCLIIIAGIAMAWLCLSRTSPYHFWWNIFLSVFMGMVLSLFAALFINKQFPQKDTITESFDVINSGDKWPITGRNMSNCDMPYVTILIQERRKSLELTCQDLEALDSYEKIECTYSVGCFGWAYINDYRAKKWK